MISRFPQPQFRLVGCSTHGETALQQRVRPGYVATYVADEEEHRRRAVVRSEWLASALPFRFRLIRINRQPDHRASDI